MNRKKTHDQCAVGFLRPEFGIGLILSLLLITALVTLLTQPVYASSKNGQAVSGQAEKNNAKAKMTAKGAGNILDNTINLSGHAEVKSVTMNNGEVVLTITKPK